MFFPPKNQIVIIIFVAMLSLLPSAASAADRDVITLEWEDLIPAAEIDLLEEEAAALEERLEKLHTAPQRMLSDAEPYDSQQTIAGFIQPTDGFSAVQALDGEKVRIPGFMVPLEFSGPGMMRDFLLVPYFGACIHVPPPPPNQIVYVDSGQDIDMEVVWGAVWVTGVLKVANHDTEYARTLYSIDLVQIDLYEEDW